MAYYPFYCETCEFAWSVKAPMAKPAQRRKCPECGKMRKRAWDSPPGLKFIGDGWYVTEARKEKFRKDGYDKENAEEFYAENIDASKRRMKSGGEHYTPMSPNYEWLEKKGQVKKVPLKEAKRKMKKARKLTQESYETAGIKPERPKHPQRMG
tara:strand:- start:263 stop:721 length:459 start_codon:yes stop_codon:yes gene_type:complete